ncbi:MAG: SPOR domain-containing protein [Methylococcales bacterium]|nr:SPOR domain-containing protein [Methylococcales bacterium]
MADSNDSKTDPSSENDSDKLDNILNKAEVAMDVSQEEDKDETVKDEFDEFSEEQFSEAETELEDIEESVADDFDQNMQEIDVEQESKSENASTDEFLMSDFDISADDLADEQEKEDEINDTAAETVQDSDKSDIDQAEQVIAKTTTEIDDLKTQIIQLWAENKAQKEQITALTDTVDSQEQYQSIVEEVEGIQVGQGKLKKSLKEAESKISVSSYVAIGIAILALLVGGGLGAVGYGAKSEVTELSELLMTLEEELELLAATGSSVEIKKLNNKVTLLMTAEEQLNKQLLEVDKLIKSKSSQTDIDGLVTKNKQLQQTIEQLSVKVAILEKRKFVSGARVSAIASKKVKKPVVKVNWVVNLVSFKQEWFAKRKATEFDSKGISVEVIPVMIKDVKWFRLRVKGFKTKYEAATYAVKAKKALNLSSVWVTKEQ